MGNICHNEVIKIEKKPLRQDIVFPEFHEAHSEIFKLSDQFNVFKYYRLEDIAFLFLQNFGDGKEHIQDSKFNLFTKNKLINNILILQHTANDTNSTARMKTFNDKFFISFYKGFKSFYKKAKGEKWENSNQIPFISFMPVAVVYGNARNDTKVDYIYSILSNDHTGEIVRDDNTLFFFFGLFAIPSFVLLYTLRLIAEEYEDFQKELEKFDFDVIFEGYEVKDAIHCCNKMMDELFGDKDRINFQEFHRKFDDPNFQILICPRGIRTYINKNNV